MATKKPAPRKAAKPVKKAKPAPKKAAPAKKVAASKPTPKKAAPAKKAMKPAPKKAVKPAPKKAAPAKVAKPVAKKPVPKKAAPAKAAKALPKKAAPAPVKAAPKKAAPVKPVPVKGAPAKGVPSKGAPAKGAPAKGAKPAPAKPAGKKVPQISPETRFAGTSTKVVSQAEIRKALRAKESKKNLKPVPMPKINTKTVRKYEPEFTKSVLDAKAQVDQTGPTQRYSDSDLAEFRELVQSKLNAAKQELSYLNGLITRKDSMSGEDSDNRYMTMEDGSLSMEREQLSQMASRQIDFIEKLEKALMRIENKTYGICRVTGRLIDKARLKAVPHATLSMEAKMGMSKNNFNSSNQ